MIEKLLESMTLDEKIAQLIQLSADFYVEDGKITGPLNDIQIDEHVVANAGSVLGISGAEAVKRVQDMHLKKNRLKIPLLVMADVVHGFETIFPVPLASAGSFNLELIEESARIAAKEARVSGVQVTFAPMVDLAIDPRWGRVMESSGEDTFYNAQVAKTLVHGFQGKGGKIDEQHVVACVKHFAGYGAVQGGRDYNYVDMSTRELYEKHFPQYKAAVDAGCKMVMTSFNTVDGIPSSGNQWLLKNVLRGEWNFNDVIISDWGSVRELIAHGVAANEEDAAKLAMNATLDIEMMTNSYVSSLKNLIEKKCITMKQIDEAVLRVLRLKEELGLFENPYLGLSMEAEKTIVFHEEHQQKAYELASESMVLLKNESNTLPLRNTTYALIGPCVNSADLQGPWSWKGDKHKSPTIYEAFIELDADVKYAQGCTYEEEMTSLLDEAVALAKTVDTIVLCLGEKTSYSGEANCVSTITLPTAQIRLAQALSKLNKKIVLVLVNGRPLDLTILEPLSDSILETWFVGSAGGSVIRDVLIGKINPSGKLTMSFPYHAGQIPVYYNSYSTGRPFDKDNAYTTKYLDIPNQPRYAFGYGLSYTSFALTDITISSDVMKADEVLTVQVNIKNTGQVQGKTVVQLYIRDHVGEVVRPMKELRGFEKIDLMPNESCIVSFKIDASMLAYYHHDLSYHADVGEFSYFVGLDSTCDACGTFTLVK